MRRTRPSRERALAKDALTKGRQRPRRTLTPVFYYHRTPHLHARVCYPAGARIHDSHTADLSSARHADSARSARRRVSATAFSVSSSEKPTAVEERGVKLRTHSKPQLIESTSHPPSTELALRAGSSLIHHPPRSSLNIPYLDLSSTRSSQPPIIGRRKGWLAPRRRHWHAPRASPRCRRHAHPPRR